MKFRISTIADAGEILDIYAPIIRETVISLELAPPTAEQMQKRINSTLEQFPWIVAEIDSQIAGYAYGGAHRSRWAYQWSCESSVYVNSRFRRRGVARQLYGVLFNLLRAQGYINAYAGVSLPNPGSEGLHESCGFRKIGDYENIGFKFEAWHSVRWYALDLVPHPVSEPPPPIPFSKLNTATVQQYMDRSPTAR
ncbi:MAG: N-acetyltransferase family protein [Planctomycetota bacterium]